MTSKYHNQNGQKYSVNKIIMGFKLTLLKLDATINI